MQFENVCIEGLGYVIPEQVVTTASLEAKLKPVYRKLGIRPGFIERLTGIKEHRWWPEDVSVSDASAMAGENAIQNSGVPRDEIQCLINASVCRDYIEPATAAIVHNKLNLSPSAMSFDIVNACLGFLNGMVIVANMIEMGQIHYGMVVAAEMPREGQLATLDMMLNNTPSKNSIRDNMASFTLGGASVGMVLSHSSVSKTGKHLLGGASFSDTKKSDLCVAQRTWMRTKSTALLKAGTKVVVKAWDRFNELMQWPVESVDKLFTHQVSEPQRHVALDSIGFSPEIDYPTLSYLGNTASVAAPISLALGIENGFVDDGDRIVLFGVGSGINSIVLGIQW